MIDLSPQYLKTVTSILAALVPAAEVRAFGSRVTWTAKSYSDLDIAIVGRRKLTLSELSKLSVAFEESDLPIRVDILDWHAISPEFQEVIRQKYEVIQEGVKEEIQPAPVKEEYAQPAKEKAVQATSKITCRRRIRERMKGLSASSLPKRVCHSAHSDVSYSRIWINLARNPLARPWPPREGE